MSSFASQIESDQALVEDFVLSKETCNLELGVDYPNLKYAINRLLASQSDILTSIYQRGRQDDSHEDRLSVFRRYLKQSDNLTSDLYKSITGEELS